MSIKETSTEKLRTAVRSARESYGPKSLRWPMQAQRARQELIARTGYAS